MGDRKVRLAALAAKAGRTKKAPDSLPPENDEDSGASKPQSVSFRNYAPTDNNLEKVDSDETAAKRQKLETPMSSSSRSKAALESALMEAKDEASRANARAGGSIVTPGVPNVNSMAPKKINWDLKRDIQSKLSKLEKRTQKAIVEMLKERLEKEAAEQVKSDESDLD